MQDSLHSERKRVEMAEYADRRAKMQRGGRLAERVSFTYREVLGCRIVH